MLVVFPTPPFALIVVIIIAMPFTGSVIKVYGFTVPVKL